MMSPIALYYPWMHFQDDNWLKLALLTWRRIVRIRPSAAEDRDGDFVRQLRAETDFIMEATPSRMVLDLVAESFGEIFDADPDFILARYGVREPASRIRNGEPRSAEWRGFQAPITQHAALPEPLSSTLTWVYVVDEGGGRMNYELRNSLVDIGLAQPADGPWIGMAPKLASIYLAVLTDAMADREMLCPATDDPRMHSAAGARDRLIDLVLGDSVREPVIEDPDSAYLHVALRAVLEPSDLARVPVGKLIRFRDRHGAELAAFQAHVADLGTQLKAIADVESPDLAVAHLNAVYETRTLPRLNELRRALRGLGVESVAGTLVQKIDLKTTAGTLLGGAAAAGGHVTVGAAAVAATLIPYVAGRIKARRQEIRDSPVGYLLAADRELTGNKLLRALRR